MRHVAEDWLCPTPDCVQHEHLSTCDVVHSDEVNAYICQGLFADQPVHGDAVTFHVAEVGGFNN